VRQPRSKKAMRPACGECIPRVEDGGLVRTPLPPYQPLQEQQQRNSNRHQHKHHHEHRKGDLHGEHDQPLDPVGWGKPPASTMASRYHEISAASSMGPVLSSVLRCIAQTSTTLVQQFTGTTNCRRAVSAMPPRATLQWHQSRLSRCAMSGLMHATSRTNRKTACGDPRLRRSRISVTMNQRTFMM
jgi:hypothetical protein